MAIGSTPAVDWLTGSGLNLDDGVRCDQTCRAAPGVVAAGDLASWSHPQFGHMRVEHHMNATEQGTAATQTLLGAATPFAPVPYFWSDQYDVKIQAYGRPSGEAELHIIADDPATHQFAALYSTDGRVTGAVRSRSG